MELPAAGDAFGVRRGWTPARGIIHLHSPYSHDACDGDPRDFQGNVDEQCLADLKAGLCASRMDFAALTDHDDSMADEDFADLFVTRGDDELLEIDGAPVAARIHCDNGHRVLLTVGAENDLMPIMLDRHPDGSVQQRHNAYNSAEPTTVELFRTLGGSAWVAHSEGHDLAQLRALQPDGIEIYNLHANIDPDIRAEHLGLDGPGAIRAVLEFGDPEPTGPEPDLALISFLSENDNAIAKWHALLGDGLRVSGSAGTDAHQNSLPLVLRDGERGDSYRRMIRWFANVVLVTDPSDHTQIEAAVATGRFFVAFELFGTPSGFDAVAGDVEMGGEITSTEVAAGAGPTVEATIAAAGAVAYRAEVLITPTHLGPHLGTLGTEHVEREYVWVYSNPFYLPSSAATR